VRRSLEVRNQEECRIQGAVRHILGEECRSLEEGRRSLEEGRRSQEEGRRSLEEERRSLEEERRSLEERRSHLDAAPSCTPPPPPALLPHGDSAEGRWMAQQRIENERDSSVIC